MNDRQKHSLVLGGLTSSAGVFISKAIGILYVSPFTSLATEANLSYYARAYNVYEIVLNISIAGLPFAIATMVAKYSLKGQFKTVLLVRKLSTAILALMGFLAMIFLLFAAHPIAQFSVSGAADSLEVLRTRNVMMIMALAVFTVPLLNSYRGFYQGLRELKIYSFSQVFEQITRVSFLLGIGFLLVYILKFDAIWAVYAAIASTSLSALSSIIYFIGKDRKHLAEIKHKAEESDDALPNRKEILKEMFYFSIPFLLNVFLNNSNNTINLLFFNNAMRMHGETLAEADLYYSMVMFTTNKLTSIPQVVAPGFITAIIPYVTTAFENKDLKQMQKHVLDSVETVFYITLPLAYFLFGISSEIYYVMYGSSNLVMGGEVLRYNSITGILFNLAAVSNALMMALRLRKQNLLVSFGGVILKFALFVPLIIWLGYKGSIYSNAINQLVLFLINMWLIKLNYKVHYTRTIRRVIFMFIGLMAMQVSFFALNAIGLHVIDQGRFIALIELGVYGVVGILAYLLTTTYFRLPQRILNLDIVKLVKRVLS